ncbi:MAG: hypothetical protein OEV06_10935, partial [Anaerolineae bacterium]|nr:hypothetical protein [Anaerolineae bacterium]
HHPTVGEIDIVFKLDSYNLGINLDDDALEPAADAILFIIIVVAQDFDTIPHLIDIFPIGRGSET